MESINPSKCSANVVESKVSQDAECGTVDHEVITLQQVVARLNEIIVNLEDTVRIKNAQLENTHREKSRLLADLKKQRRCNGNLKQQLDDDRSFHQREKDYYIKEMQRYQGRYVGNNTSKFHQQRLKELEQVQDTLETENEQLKKELMDKNEITYNLCIKFLRMKHAKDTLRYKLDQLLHEHLLVMAEMMEKLDEARKELNLIVSEKFQEPLPLNKAKFLQVSDLSSFENLRSRCRRSARFDSFSLFKTWYGSLQVVQRNNRLMYENATLKVQVHQLAQNVEKLKSHVQRPKKINVDAKIIEKLSAQSSTRSTMNRIEKISLLSKLSSSINYSGGETISEVGSRNINNYTLNDARDIKNDSKDSYTERAQSAPGIVESTISRQLEE
ncbi:hypothetical protein DMN91_010226 [Ooceraea biroi]|uniref:Uncharacterized protein n=1 Tax=Ooceraea biroi TaxID=2015173 RepID=A0A3L8DBZ2_OOCBI|nr:uncharacterized protein LOC113562850 [Ooceraea biroi]RLU17985.1 hypothetical protein DMN91_010226 [Ooceraea biroi]